MVIFVHILRKFRLNVTNFIQFRTSEAFEHRESLYFPALGSFFHPKTALHPQIWNKGEFETGGYIEIKARNQPKKLMVRFTRFFWKIGFLLLPIPSGFSRHCHTDSRSENQQGADFNN